MSDNYPEHLNPFAGDVRPKRRVSIKDSFKDFRRSLRQSFRIKKKDNEEVTIRQKPAAGPRLPVLYLSQDGEALPRSRFRERLSKRPDSNPFEEEENNDDSISTIIRRRGKKRAPLPPKSRSSQQINEDHLEIQGSASHWSLTSVETDYSCVTHDENGGDEAGTGRESVAEEFVEFNKNMDSLKDDTNNNVITKEECSQEKDEEEANTNNIPDLVVSCPSETAKKLSTDHTNENEDALSLKYIEEDDDDSSVSKEDTTELVVTDISNNLILDADNDNHVKNHHEIQVDDQSSKGEAFLYHEHKSLHIAGSKDELHVSSTYEGKISLYITGSSDHLDASNNNESLNDANDENCNDGAMPTPKQRRNKLTKDALLGM